MNRLSYLILMKNKPVQPRLWNIEEFPFHPEKLNHIETLMTVGNGYLATRGSFEEGYEGDIVTTLIHGIFNHASGTAVPELVNAPNWLPFEVHIDGTPFRLVNQNEMSLNPRGGALLGYRQQLNMHIGLLRREALFRAESGSIVRIVFERFASLHDEHILGQRLDIVAVDGSPKIEVTAYIEHTVTNNGVIHWTDIKTGHTTNQVSLSAKTTQSDYRLGMSSTLLATGDMTITVDRGNQRPVMKSVFVLPHQESVTLVKLTTVYTSRDVTNPLKESIHKLENAAIIGYEKLLNQHQSEWHKYWQDSDIQIEGDEIAQLSLRFAMYHILISAPRHDNDVSIGAKTLSGFGYKGHVFWDTELFILPPLILTQPELARNLLMYRYHRLPGARHKAKANGYEGAMYPWESTDTGEETTPQWGDPQPDGSRIRIWTGDNEQHISTDIAYAVLQYWRWTGDDTFLARYGAEIILDTAVFWGSRVETKNGRYEISRQIGPDEYHENVDNSVFTNRMVVWHLEQAVSLVHWLKANTLVDYNRLVESLNLTQARLELWNDIIKNMFIPFDDAQQIHIQFPGFFDMEYIPVSHYYPRTASVQAILGHQRSIQTQVIKQADVVMLMALLGEEVGASEVMVNNWNTYFPRTDHGSSLSPSIHAWVAAHLGLDDIALEQFEHAAEIDLRNNKGNVQDGIHGAASGGLWQAVVFGFCGLYLDEKGEPVVEARIPDHWKSVTFTVCYRGERRQFTITPN
ncbi:MAG: beta-phosphoglucomutase [Anaerolineaceae bacterium]|nr:beta-phosphoglucomutase [Anaerolineaceae bacterium]